MSVDLPGLDLAMPDLARGGVEERMARIADYLVLLSEQLRYTVGSLGTENFSAGGLADLSAYISRPLAARIDDAEGRVAQLGLTAGALAVRITDAEGNLSTLTQTAQGLLSRMSGAEGGITALAQTVGGLSLSAADGALSCTLELRSGSAVLSSATVRITGMVTFSALSGSGASVINGDNITTGVIRARDMESCTFKTLLTGSGASGQIECYYLDYWSLAGGIRLDDGGTGTESQYRMFLYTNEVDSIPFALKLQSAGGMSLYSMSNLYVRATSDLTLTSDYGDLNVIAPVIRPYAGATGWTFRADGIYYGGVRKVAV